jgi:hypothetical protein
MSANITQLMKQLELETDRHRKARLAEQIATMLIRAAKPKRPRAKPRKPEPPPPSRSKWRHLSDLRKILNGREGNAS